MDLVFDSRASLNAEWPENPRPLRRARLFEFYERRKNEGVSLGERRTKKAGITRDLVISCITRKRYLLLYIICATRVTFWSYASEDKNSNVSYGYYRARFAPSRTSNFSTTSTLCAFLVSRYAARRRIFPRNSITAVPRSNFLEACYLHLSTYPAGEQANSVTRC